MAVTMMHEVFLALRVPEHTVTPRMIAIMHWRSVRGSAIYSATSCLTAYGRKSEDYFTPITPGLDITSLLAEETDFMCLTKIFIRYYAREILHFNNTHPMHMALTGDHNIRVCKLMTSYFDQALFPHIENIIRYEFEHTERLDEHPVYTREGFDRDLRHYIADLVRGQRTVRMESEEGEEEGQEEEEEEEYEMEVEHEEEAEEDLDLDLDDSDDSDDDGIPPGFEDDEFVDYDDDSDDSDGMPLGSEDFQNRFVDDDMEEDYEEDVFYDAEQQHQEQQDTNGGSQANGGGPQHGNVLDQDYLDLWNVLHAAVNSL